MNISVRRPRWLSDDLIRGVRWGAVLAWLIVFGNWIYDNGIPYWRTDLLLWLCIGLAAASIGKRNILTVVLDFLPFVLVLIVYDKLRGVADSAGMPTWWHPQVDVDKFLFFGTVPTVWLQEHLKHTDPRWYDTAAAFCYISFFFLPYLTATVLWLRKRADFYRWGLRFVALSFIGFGLFVLIPAAPPWAAAKCTATDVADHPYNPSCMNFPSSQVDGNLLGPYGPGLDGAHQYVENGMATRGLPSHLRFASQLVDAGRVSADAVAAVPSLHVGGTVLFVLFMWTRVRKGWKPLLVAYPLFMMFSLAYTAEHYVADGLAGALCAALVHFGGLRIERWWRGRRQKGGAAVDTLNAPPDHDLEISCPPTQQPSETTQSST